MSIFGDRTPAQEMLEMIEGVQNSFHLADKDVLTILLHIVLWYQEGSSFINFDKIQMLKRDDDE